MHKLNLFQILILFLVSLILPYSIHAQFDKLIPSNTATHTAVKSGDWNNNSTWDSGSVPGLAAIVIIPAGVIINYNVNSNQQVFALRNDGTLKFEAPNGIARKLVVDTYVNSMGSIFDISADKATDGIVEIIVKAFDIEKKRNGQIGGANWNTTAKNHFRDGAPVYDHFNKKLPSDGPGVLGRYSWDPKQVTLGVMAHGKTRIMGYEKEDFIKMSSNLGKGSNKLTLSENPVGWKIGDQILVTGTKRVFVEEDPDGTEDEVFKIKAINGKQITLDRNAIHSHQGLGKRNLFPYAANLTRSIIIRSFQKNNVSQRGHSMFMISPDIEIMNAAFIDLGRTNKQNVIDDFQFGLKRIGTDPKYNKPIVTLQNLKYEPAEPKNIENQRGRYALHFHKTGAKKGAKLAKAHGNVIWGSPGWGMVHHDSHASFKDNIVFYIFGGGMIAESGSESGVWEHNLVTSCLFDDSKYLFAEMGENGDFKREVRDNLDDDFGQGECYGLQSRAVRMVGNVAASSEEGYHYQGSGTQVPVADMVDSNILPFDMFPLQNDILRNAPALIEFKDNEAFACQSTFKSQGRSENSYHRAQSMIENLIGWNLRRRAMYLTSNFGYTFKNNYYHCSRNNGQAALISIDDDNLNWSNVTFESFGSGGIKGGVKNHDPKAHFLFHNVTWIDHKGNPYKELSNKFYTILKDADLYNGAMKFTPNSTMDTKINVNTGDFKVVVDGNIKDNAGNDEFPHFSRKKPENQRRTYNFKNKATLDKYLDKYGSFNDSKGVYTILTEFISDRLTGKVTPFEFRIDLIGVDANDNNAPKVSFITPSNDISLPEGSNVSAEVAATDSDGSISSVTLYLNNTLIRQDNTAPYFWGGTAGNPLLQNLSTGVYTLKAIAIDNEGAQSSTSLKVTIENDNNNIAPELTIIQPLITDTFIEGDNITVRANATDIDGSIKGISLYLNNELIRTDTDLPYGWGGNEKLQNITPGTYVLKLIAEDNEGLTTTKSLTIKIGSLENYKTIPGLIQAEEFDINQGVQIVANTTDPNGGQNIGYINSGDNVQYKVNVTKPGIYRLNTQAGSKTTGGDIKVIIGNKTITTIKVPNTGGWQSWKTIRKTIELEPGITTLKLIFEGESNYLMNVNWIRFVHSSDRDFDSVKDADSYLQIIPNPVKGEIMNISQKGNQYLQIVNILGAVIKEISPGDQESLIIDVSSLSKGVYILKSDKSSTKFIIE